MCEIFKGVKYCYENGEFIVGNGSTTYNNAEFHLESPSIIIPKSVKGHQVKGIGQYAFAENRKIVEVIIYAELTHIDRWAFCRCVNLAVINIPPSCTYLGECAFDEHDVITELRSTGCLSIFFEKGIRNMTFDRKAIGVKDYIKLFFCGSVEITYLNTDHFIDIGNLSVFSITPVTVNGQVSQIVDICYQPPYILINTQIYDNAFSLKFIPLISIFLLSI